VDRASDNPSIYQAELTLEPSTAVPRRLDLSLTVLPTLYASVVCQGIYICNANGSLGDCYLDSSVGGYEFLSIDRACIRVTEFEAARIREVFAPLGLLVKEPS